MIRWTIDGSELESEPGATIAAALDAAGQLEGLSLPHYCWHPKLSFDGSCRACQVEIVTDDGEAALALACATPVRTGMVVRTDTERARRARAGVLELLLLRHPNDCPICERAGECALQDDVFEAGALQSPPPAPTAPDARRRVELGPTLELDQRRCILCRRCVRFSREVTGGAELGVVGRGEASVVDVVADTAIDHPYSLNLAELCPVGALTSPELRSPARPWQLTPVPSVCDGCARGCNVWIDAAEDRVVRYRARRNDAVNGTWLCDEGRRGSRSASAPHRLREPVRRIGGTLEACGIDEALAVAAERLRRVVDAKGPGVVAFVASGRATNEELATLRRLLDELGGAEGYVAVLRGEADALLRCEERAPNARGARLLGLAQAEALVERIRGGAVDALVAVGSELVDAALLGSHEPLRALDTVISIETHKTDLHRVAHVAIPARHTAERAGTFTSHEGRVQAIAPAAPPPPGALDAGDALARLARALGLDGFDERYDVSRVSASLAALAPSFTGIDLATVGLGGCALPEAGRGA